MIEQILRRTQIEALLRSSSDAPILAASRQLAQTALHLWSECESQAALIRHLEQIIATQAETIRRGAQDFTPLSERR